MAKIKFAEAMKLLQASKYTDAMAALAALAEEGDEDAKKAMKKMLGTAKAEGDEGGGDGDKKSSAPPPAEKKAEKEDDKPKAAAAPVSTELDVMAEVVKLRNEMAARDERDERVKLVASRADLTADPKMAEWLQAMPMAQLREAVARLPRAAASLPIQGTGTPVRGDLQGGGGLPAAQAEDLEIRMGLKNASPAKCTRAETTFRGSKIVFGGTPEQARIRLGEGLKLGDQ